MLGVPYNDDEVANADINAEKQAEKVYEGLLSQDPSLESVKDTEVIALIAYLQSLGKKTSQQGVASSSR
jgi:cytochrome c oxidase cbb3-type subunit I/II